MPPELNLEKISIKSKEDNSKSETVLSNPKHLKIGSSFTPPKEKEMMILLINSLMTTKRSAKALEFKSITQVS
jgi:hypothetical protein